MDYKITKYPWIKAQGGWGKGMRIFNIFKLGITY